ncbi:hypothetical protein O0I10_008428 [Lichtheimia ornata]|uniref:Uncharacterized protein n=1 Tax=Lichtheimia ornata TaxID=688661 RepID=A0AAD7XWY6_9FUNG|nr:uncharacterized protein O0I10_008428 [Lichtheimia ornata]KAJ8655988.1 hypothetical protein O0I10_008428 [Lichtheimia ornata]
MPTEKDAMMRLYTGYSDSGDEEEEGDLIDGFGNSSIELIDLGDLSDDEQVNNHSMDDCGPFVKEAFVWRALSSS